MLKCVMVGRQKKRQSGLNRLSELWRRMLDRCPNWKVDFIGDNISDWSSMSNTHLVVLSGESAMEEQAYKKIRQYTNAPIVTITLFRNDKITDKKERARLKRLNRKFGGVYFALWDNSYRYFNSFNSHRGHIIALPKPIVMPQPSLSLPFSKRKGICVGQYLKVMNGRFAARSKHDSLNCPKAIIAKLIRKFPKIPFYAYGADNSNKPKGLHIVSPGNKLVEDFLPTIRIFLSLQSNETFYLVPIEAQGVGTPVIYRHMPQSLTPYLGFSAPCIDNMNQLYFYIHKLYNNRELWEQYSRMSIKNAQNLGWEHRADAMGLELERLVKGH